MKSKKRPLGLTVWLATASFLVGCGSSSYDHFTSNTSNGTEVPRVTALVVTPKTTTKEVSEFQKFVATATFSDGSTADVTPLAQWSSSNPSRVSIQSTIGLATALLPGQATITAEASGFSDTATMTVSPLMTRVSVSSAGTEGNEASAQANITPDGLSADGRFAAFESDASNLVTGDTNAATDVFVHDRVTGTTTRVSVDSAGGQGNAFSFKPKISDDGRFVVFESQASNLVAGDTNGTADVFVHDMQTGATTRVSVDSAGLEANAKCNDPAISGNGQFVAFVSNASNLVSGDTNAKLDVFVHDRQTGATTRVSVDSAGVEGNANSVTASLSTDGRFVSFDSSATNLVAGDTNAKNDVFVRDRLTSTTTRVSLDSAAAQADNDSFESSISGDGRFVAFESQATNLVAGDTNGVNDIFRHDRQTGTTIRLSLNSADVQGDAVSRAPSISADGLIVAFESSATNLVAGDTNGVGDIFVRDIVAGITTRVSHSVAGTQANNQSTSAAMSADGRFVSFRSYATNLVTGDTNAFSDVFLTTR